MRLIPVGYLDIDLGIVMDPEEDGDLLRHEMVMLNSTLKKIDRDLDH